MKSANRSICLLFDYCTTNVIYSVYIASVIVLASANLMLKSYNYAKSHNSYAIIPCMYIITCNNIK